MISSLQMNHFLTLLSIATILFFSCQNFEKIESQKTYVVLGHIYDWTADGSRIDKRLEKVNFKNYKGIWLGGDICSETTKSSETIKYLDHHFNLESAHTLWALGNHDIRNGNFEFIQNITNRDSYYSYDFEAGQVIVLNTQMTHDLMKDSCEWRANQGDFFHDQLDQILISEGQIDNLIIFSHQAIWSDCEQPLTNYERIGNQKAAWMSFYCGKLSTFRTEYFNKLKEIQNQGINVICVAGDGGQYQKTFYQKGYSDIQYYVTGINNSVLKTNNDVLISKYNSEPDSVLIFKFDNIDKSFNGEYIPLENL
ncbi:MAG: metallophosphoesterase [Saprospiraceae bacterium]|nr:metallophosphoesterase [Bacteroidia bacterium]NNE13724.1 metallophosphoesterase [Saprospiraceae bacterium]NNL91816.1 metallophosphoesterase [Saprospiraceae bacterium]